MDKIIYILCSCALFFACNLQRNQETANDFYYEGDTLCILESSNILSKIVLQTIRLQPYSAQFATTGTVKAMTGKLAGVASPFDGRVAKSFVRLGQRVQAGTPVFELSSADFYEASKNYFQTLQTKKMAEINLNRQKDLVQHGVGVQKELEEAETNCEFAQRDYENAVAGLKMFNIRPEELVMGQALTVVSPIDGEIVSTNAVLGEYVKSDSDPLFVVAELSNVWVAAQVKEKYIGAVHPDNQVHVTTDTDADAGHEIVGCLYHIGEMLDEETRSIQVLVECNNKDRKLRPGMFVNVRFTGSPQDAVVIPSAALLQTETGSYVFVETGRNKYIKRYVKTVTLNQKESVITEGLQVGEVIVSGGAIYLMDH